MSERQDGDDAGAKANGSRRLALFFAFLGVLESAVLRGWMHKELLAAAFRGARADAPWVERFFQWSAHLVDPLASMLAFGSIFIAAIALSVRLARAATPGSARDPVIRLRGWLRRHARFANLLPWVPALLMIPEVVRAFVAGAMNDAEMMSGLMAPLALAAAGSLTALAGRFALRSLDQVRDRASEPVTTVERDETTFLAVAVTPRTQGAVLGMFLAPLALLLLVTRPGLRAWLGETGAAALVATYIATALGTAYWFRKASTIAVGRDGIFVRGTSKERFFSYRDFDEVRLAGVHFDFHRQGRRVLRLQLHGADDVRADALAERIRAALAASQRTGGAHLLAQSAAAGTLGRAVQGASDYRQPSISREQLWELVEGDATDAQARMAAATALASIGDGAERARLRIAASHVADPQVRIALEELGEETADEREAAPTAAARPVLRGIS